MTKTPWNGKLDMESDRENFLFDFLETFGERGRAPPTAWHVKPEKKR